MAFLILKLTLPNKIFSWRIAPLMFILDNMDAHLNVKFPALLEFEVENTDFYLKNTSSPSNDLKIQLLA